MKFAINSFFMILIAIGITGCASAPPRVVTTTELPQPYPKGIYHSVMQGQTLWKIAKAYNIDVNSIITANHISDASRIDIGQMLFIPGATKQITGELKTPPSKGKGGFIWPLKGKVISYFGSKKDNVTSKGIDIEAEDGQTIVAARSGKVAFCDDKVKGLGKAIIIDHGDGYSTLYAHNSVNLVQCEDFVKQNQPIARAGSTGRAGRPTLHFQIRKAHKPRNPFYYLP